MASMMPRRPADNLKQATGVTTPAQALTAVRVVWGAMIAGQVAFLAFAFYVRSTGGLAALPASTARLLLSVAIGLLAGATVAAYTVRPRVMGAERPVPPPKYVAATIAFHGILESASVFGIVVMMLGPSPLPALVIPLIATGIMAVNFPTGSDLARD